MTLNDYQSAAAKTALYPKEKGLEYTTLGLVGEAGEIANKVKKILRGDKELTLEVKDQIGEEIGDALYYCAMLSKEIGFDFETIARRNNLKLADRMKRGVIKGDGDNR